MQLDEAIVAYVRKKYGMIIGRLTAEQVKITIGAAVPQDEEQTVELQGQDQVTGLSRPITLTTGEVVEALQDPLHQTIETARRVLEKTPPELVSDTIDVYISVSGEPVADHHSPAVTGVEPDAVHSAQARARRLRICQLQMLKER